MSLQDYGRFKWKEFFGVMGLAIIAVTVMVGIMAVLSPQEKVPVQTARVNAPQAVQSIPGLSAEWDTAITPFEWSEELTKVRDYRGSAAPQQFQSSRDKFEDFGVRKPRNFGEVPTIGISSSTKKRECTFCDWPLIGGVIQLGKEIWFILSAIVVLIQLIFILLIVKVVVSIVRLVRDVISPQGKGSPES